MSNLIERLDTIAATVKETVATVKEAVEEAADEIVKHCELSMIDWDKLKAKTEQIGYPIIAVVNQINANCRDRLGEYCHWGATTQDITRKQDERNEQEPESVRPVERNARGVAAPVDRREVKGESSSTESKSRARPGPASQAKSSVVRR